MSQQLVIEKRSERNTTAERSLEEAMASIVLVIKKENSSEKPAFWYKFYSEDSPPVLTEGSVKEKNLVWFISGRRNKFPFGPVVGDVVFDKKSPFTKKCKKLRGMYSREVGNVEDGDYVLRLKSDIKGDDRRPCVLKVNQGQESPHSRLGFRFGEKHSVTILSFPRISELAIENEYGKEVSFLISAGGSHVPIKLRESGSIELNCKQLGASLKFTDLKDSSKLQSGGTDHIQIFIEGNGPSDEV